MLDHLPYDSPIVTRCAHCDFEARRPVWETARLFAEHQCDRPHPGAVQRTSDLDVYRSGSTSRKPFSAPSTNSCTSSSGTIFVIR